MSYIYRIQLQGATDSDRTTLSFDLGTPAEHLDAVNAANQIRGALVDITKAFVKKETLTEILSEDNQLPSDPSADTFEELLLMCHLNAPTEAKKLVGLRIPAPEESLFAADGESADVTNALLVQYVQQISQHAFVSDGEQINTATGANGMDKGWKRSRSRSFR